MKRLPCEFGQRHRIPLDIQLNAAQVASIIKVQFPDVSLSSVAHLGEGCDSTAFEVNGQLVFRFPKRADVDQQLAIESRILPRSG